VVAEVGSIDTLAEWLKMWQLLWKQWPERLPREKREQRKQRVQLEEQLMQLEERDLLEDQHQQRVKHMRFMMSMDTQWRKWLNLPNSLTHVQQTSLKVTLSTRMHWEASSIIRNMVEEALVRRLPHLTELTTSRVLPIFPRHLRKLRFHSFAISEPCPSITLPSLVSLEIITDSPDHLLIVGCIQAPQLRSPSPSR
jgi:hypothetical protein